MAAAKGALAGSWKNASVAQAGSQAGRSAGAARAFQISSATVAGSFEPMVTPVSLRRISANWTREAADGIGEVRGGGKVRGRRESGGDSGLESLGGGVLDTGDNWEKSRQQVAAAAGGSGGREWEGGEDGEAGGKLLADHGCAEDGDSS